ncbi:MAG: hypothetical protein ACOYK9_02905, partial [Chlamydiia bacterium]
MSFVKKIFSLGFCGLVMANPLQLPQRIDSLDFNPLQDQFGNFTPKDINFCRELCENGGLAFNKAPEVALLFAYLKEQYDIDVAVETGTFQANTTAFLGSLFDEVHTFELDKSSFLAAREALEEISHIHCHFANSGTDMGKILESIKDKRVIFYLDAHWNEYCPLLDEIRQIAKTHKDNCIIVIDDFELPGEIIGYRECTMDGIRDVLKDVFSEYTYHFIATTDPVNKAPKGLIIPTKFVEKQTAENETAENETAE